MKRFIIKLFLFFTPVLIPVIFYLALLVTRECSGDIGLMAKIFFEKGYHKKLSIIPDSILIQDTEIQNIPDSSTILCFGDSFANQRPYAFLQPLGEYCGKPIFNVLYNLDNAAEEAAFGFLSYAPQSKIPSIMIVESVERACVAQLYWIDTTSPFTIDQMQKGKKHKSSTPRKSFDKELISFYKFRLGWANGIVPSQLNKFCFTSKGNEDELYSYYEDTIQYSQEMIDGAADKLKQMHKLAKQRNVKLIYIVAPNKSTLYAPHSNNRSRYFTIEDNPAFDTLPYCFNPIKILRQLDENGEKDIYYCDDTHWTPKTAKKVGEELTKLIFKL